MKTKLVARNLAVLGVLGMAACLGNIGDGSSGAGGSSGSGTSSGTSSGTGSGGSGGSGGGTSIQCADVSLAPARLSLISDDQYRNIVHDVFGVAIPASYNGGSLTTQASTSGSYPINEGAQIQMSTLQEYQRAADEVASLITTMAPCTTGAVNATCVESFLRAKLPLAWRRPVTDTEIAGLINIFNLGAPDGVVRQTQLIMEAALIHPAFLYRTELGTNAATATGKINLTSYELASALSFAVTNSAPDAELWAKAQDGSLTSDPTVLPAEVTRLMSLPAVQANLMKKVSYFLDFEALPYVQKDASAYPGYAALQPILYQSAQMFLGSIIWSGTFSDLFTSNTIYANQAMAAAYGLPAVSGTQLTQVTPPAGTYNAGVLTQPALLAASNTAATGDDVIHRGLWIYYNLLGAPPLPPPPANALTVAASLAGKSTRYQAAYRDGVVQGETGSGCGIGCHSKFDPLGIVTMSYDGIGRYRTIDPSETPPAPVDDTTTILPGVLTDETSMTGTPVASAADLANLLVKGRQVSDCAADHLATYMLEHNPDAALVSQPAGTQVCALQKVKDTFHQSGKFADLFSAILTSPAFLTRDL
jgi:hypothetical protein